MREVGGEIIAEFEGEFEVGELHKPVFISADIWRTVCLCGELNGSHWQGDLLVLYSSVFELAIEDLRFPCHETLEDGAWLTHKSIF